MGGSEGKAVGNVGVRVGDSLGTGVGSVGAGVGPHVEQPSVVESRLLFSSSVSMQLMHVPDAATKRLQHVGFKASHILHSGCKPAW